MDETLYNTTDVPTTTTDFDEYYSAYEQQMTLIYRIFLELYTVLSLVCLAADILIIYVITKYRRLRNDKANVILLNWAVLNTFFMITQPPTLRISFSWTDTWNSTMFCIAEQAEYTALTGNVLLIELLFIYWFLKVYYPTKCVKFEKHIRVALGIFYLFLIFALAVHLEGCINRRYLTLSELFLLLLYLIFIVFMIIMNITHFIKKRKLIQTTVISNIPLILCNVFFFSIVPMLTVIMIHFITRIEHVTALILINISLILAVMNPIYFFVVLYKCDKNFKTFFGYIFSCQCRKYGDEMVEETVVFNGDVQM